MKQIHDENSANDVYAENKQEREEVNEKKNSILRMSNTKKKQEAWSELFPKLEVSNIPY